MAGFRKATTVPKSQRRKALTAPESHKPPALLVNTWEGRNPTIAIGEILNAWLVEIDPKRKEETKNEVAEDPCFRPA